MPTIQIDSEQLLDAALQMPRAELERFIARLFTLKVRQETPNISEREAEILPKINQGLPPAAGRRLKELIVKRQSRVITDEELQELIRITDESERLNVERVKHLIELAALRDIPLDKLMDQLGLKPADS